AAVGGPQQERADRAGRDAQAAEEKSDVFVDRTQSAHVQINSAFVRLLGHPADVTKIEAVSQELYGGCRGLGSRALARRRDHRQERYGSGAESQRLPLAGQTYFLSFGRTIVHPKVCARRDVRSNPWVSGMHAPVDL